MAVTWCARSAGAGSGLVVQRKRSKPKVSSGTNHPYAYCGLVAQSTLRALNTSSQRIRSVPPPNTTAAVGRLDAGMIAASRLVQAGKVCIGVVPGKQHGANQGRRWIGPGEHSRYFSIKGKSFLPFQYRGTNFNG